MPRTCPSHDRQPRPHGTVGTKRNRERLFTGALTAWLACAGQIVLQAQPAPQSNWTSSDVSCAKYEDLRSPVLGDIGVKIDVDEPWAEGFRRALRFWNTVLVANLHEESSFSSCAVRVINADRSVLNEAMVARAQFPEWLGFRGKIAVSPRAGSQLNSTEIYGTAVHELGHLFGLNHNPSSGSVMYFLDVSGDEVLDASDLLSLSRHHRLRSVIYAGRLSVRVFGPETPAVATVLQD